jgi:hypothetical protein
MPSCKAGSSGWLLVIGRKNKSKRFFRFSLMAHVISCGPFSFPTQIMRDLLLGAVAFAMMVMAFVLMGLFLLGAI